MRSDASRSRGRSPWHGAAAGGVFIAVLPITWFAGFFLAVRLGSTWESSDPGPYFCGSGPGLVWHGPSDSTVAVWLALSTIIAAYVAYRAHRWLGRTRASQLENLEHG
jgi:hypothetical protein